MFRKSPFLLLIGLGIGLIGGCGVTAPAAAPRPAATTASPTATATPSASPAVAPVSSGPSAPPTFDEARDHNPLNRLTKAKAMACDGTPAVRPRQWDTMKRYLTAIKSCLDRFWTREFARADIRYAKPAAVFVRKPPKKFCGLDWRKGAGGMYCATKGLKDDQRFTVVVRRSDAWPELRLDMAILTAHEYGHHIQNQSGYETYVDKAFWRVENKGDKAADQVNRRSELQTECIAGIAVGAFNDSLFGSTATYDAYHAYYANADQSAAWDRSHGLPRTKVAWLARGWSKRTMGACDTWRAKSSEVT